MTIGDRTYRYSRSTHGTLHHKNLYSTSFGYTETRKKVAAGATDAVANALASSTSSTVHTSGLTNPDVPRALSVSPDGTTDDVAAGVIEIHGTNIEGADISEEFIFAANATDEVVGNKAFKTVTRVDIPPQDGADATFHIGTTNKLGVNHRLFASNTTVKVYASTDVATRIPPTLQNAPTVVADEVNIEQNLVTPATTPDGTTFLSILYTFDSWATAPVNDEPQYITSTSTSTSTTTATTTSTSTSSTSTSTSSTSVSTSSTSSSSSSTSTSTTTTP